MAKNTLIYLIGNAGGKILQMLMLPLITAMLATEEYGYYDLVITSISLVTPIVTLQLTEAMFRDLFEGTDSEKTRTLSTVLVFLAGSIFVLLIAVILAAATVPSIIYPALIYLVYIGSIAQTCLQKVARSEQRNLGVAISGIVYVVVMVLAQALMLVVFNMKTEGMLIAVFLAYLASALYLESKVKVRRRISLAFFDASYLKELVALALPLVPNSVCWWLVSACNKYLVSALVSVAANGIFAIATNFAQLITFVTSVFQMAWQESSIMESSSEGRGKFYTATFNSYMRLMIGGFIIALPLIRLILPIMVSPDYQSAYLYAPPLLASAVLSAFSQFYGSAYLAFRRTKGALSSTVLAALVNCGLTLLLIPHIGLFAPALGSAAAFLVQWLFRIVQTRSYFKLEIDKRALAVGSLLSIAIVATYYLGGVAAQVASLAVGSIFFVFSNKALLRTAIGAARRNR